MRKLRIVVLGTFLLSTFAATGLAFAMAPMEQEAKTCGAWEWIGGTDFRRGCSDGSLYWYEYR